MRTTIKTYKALTYKDALQLLSDNNGAPVIGVKLGGAGAGDDMLYGVALRGDGCVFFDEHRTAWPNCDKLTEIDVCTPPVNAKEFPDWLAYVGQGRDIPESIGCYYCATSHGKSWLAAGSNRSECLSNKLNHYAVDIRTAWAQKNFPEHCLLRERSGVFHRWFTSICMEGTGGAIESLCKDAFELGQKNPSTL